MFFRETKLRSSKRRELRKIVRNVAERQRMDERQQETKNFGEKKNLRTKKIRTNISTLRI